MTAPSRSLKTSLPFTKMTGSGNDFIVIDNRSGLIADGDLAAFARVTCRRGLGIGADGVILIESPTLDAPDVDFHWRSVNADGSDGELCGNGAMCGARFAVRHGIAPEHCRFSTMSGVVKAEVPANPADSRISIALVDSGPVRLGLVIDEQVFDAVTIGVPHVVTVVNDADTFAGPGAFHAWGEKIRHNDAFAPAGTNVNVIHLIDGHTLRMRTYERGVEAETLACGTGAAASAILAAGRGLVSPPVTVITSSGLPIVVSFDRLGDAAINIRITGEARFVATGELLPEGWL
jgi:diaminopimelate epimerase